MAGGDGWKTETLEQAFEADMERLKKLASELSGKGPTGQAPKGDRATIEVSSPDGLTRDVELALDRIPSYIVESLRPALDAAIDASWGWRTGSRDIVDTGALKNSLSITTSGGRISITYSVPYAGIVHYGGYIRPYGNPYAEPVYLPPRPWIGAVLGDAQGPVQPLDLNALAEKAFKVS